jgi:hypothetical protein
METESAQEKFGPPQDDLGGPHGCLLIVGHNENAEGLTLGGCSPLRSALQGGR